MLLCNIRATARWAKVREFIYRDSLRKEDFWKAYLICPSWVPTKPVVHQKIDTKSPGIALLESHNPDETPVEQFIPWLWISWMVRTPSSPLERKGKKFLHACVSSWKHTGLRNGVPFFHFEIRAGKGLVSFANWGLPWNERWIHLVTKGPFQENSLPVAVPWPTPGPVGATLLVACHLNSCSDVWIWYP